MAFNERTVAEIVRHRLGIPDASQNPRIIFQIPTALEQLARKVAANPRKRSLLTTVRDLTVLELVDGYIDLETYNQTADKKILVEYLHCGTLWYQTEAEILDYTGSSNVSDLIHFPDHPFETGDGFQFPSGLGVTPGRGLLQDTTYYAIWQSADYFFAAASLEDAINGDAIDLTATEPTGYKIRPILGTLDSEPMHRINAEQSRNYPNNPFGSDYRFYWLDGARLKVVPAVRINSLLNGGVRFAVPYQPTLAQIALIPELQGDFLEKLVELCAGPGNDTAADGEH